MLREHFGDRALHRIFLADVADVRAGLAAGLCDFGANALEFVARAADERHRRAQARQFMRGAAPDAGAAAGDDNHLALEQAGAVNRPVRRIRRGVGCGHAPIVRGLGPVRQRGPGKNGRGVA